MNSIKADIALEIQDFFYKELMPLAMKLRDEGQGFFPVTVDPAARSYYSRRTKTTMTPKDFEMTDRLTVSGFEAALIELWLSQGHLELAVLAPTLARLATSLYCLEEQPEALSPFIYVMF